MHVLELKVPPAALALLIALAMRGASLVAPSVALPLVVRAFAGVVFAVAGVGIVVAGIVSFRRVKTTTNPTKPYSTSALVSSGNSLGVFI